MKRSLKDIKPTVTSHEVGLKRVLLAANESGCSLTQIAVTELKAGEIAAAHIHPDMQEAFFVMEGDLDVTLDEQVTHCHKDDFVYVPSCTSHELKAITDVKVMTLGCVVEAQRTRLYPMLLEPNLHTVVWGGDRLAQWKGMKPQDGIGESWEVSAVESSPSVVANGTWAGYSLVDVISQMPEEILGKKVAHQYHNKLPLLVKFIDAKKDLSIQVHPDDRMAQREHGKFGKTEMWYVISAKPGSCLYAGFKQEITPEEYKQRIADGTITQVLARHEVKPGDVFYIPAGRIHAICGGILLAEVQQSSDVTYRIFDYNRPGIDGKPRELHTDLAAKALDFHVDDEYRTIYRESGNRAVSVIDSPFFNVRVTDIEPANALGMGKASGQFHRNLIKYDSFVISMCIQGDCKIKIRSTGDEITLREGFSCLIPAAIADYDVIPLHGKSKILDAFIDNRSLTFNKALNRFFHLSNK